MAEKEFDMVDPPEPEPESEEGICKVMEGCQLHIGPCPFSAIPMFWRITFWVMAVSLTLLVLTTWRLTRVVEADTADLQVVKSLIMSGHDGLSVKMDTLKTATLENRSIQTETRGILSSYISNEYFRQLQGSNNKDQKP